MAITKDQVIWEDQSNAMPLTEQDKETWLSSVLHDLNNEEPFSYAYSGDSLVIGLKFGDGTYRLFDCRVNKVAEVGSSGQPTSVSIDGD